MGWTPFYQISIEIENHFLNFEWTQTCSSIVNWTQTPYFRFWTNRHQTLNLIAYSLDLQNYSSNRLELRFLNIERTKTCLCFVIRTQVPYFWLWAIEYRTTNIVQPITTNMKFLASKMLENDLCRLAELSKVKNLVIFVVWNSLKLNFCLEQLTKTRILIILKGLFRCIWKIRELATL